MIVVVSHCFYRSGKVEPLLSVYLEEGCGKPRKGHCG